MRNSRRRATLFVVAAAMVSACGNGGSTAPATETEERTGTPPESEEPTPVDLEPIKVIVPGLSPVLAGTVALGEAAGIFDDLGLSVDVQFGIGGSQNAISLVVAGEADLAEISGIAAGALEVQGQDISIVWGVAGGGLGMSLITGADGASTVEELQASAADGCSFAVTSPGSSSYGYAKTFSQALGIDCELIEFGEVGQIIGAVVSGRADAFAGPVAGPINAAVQDGNLQVLFSTSDPDDNTIEISRFTERTFAGMAENLEAKRASVEAFVTGMRQAAEAYASMSNEEIANLLLTLEEYQVDYPEEADFERLQADVEQARAFVNWDDGHISEENWSSQLEAATTWEVPDFDADDPARSYDAVVDMSFYDASTE